eukprot:ANDGO_02166.mRNA.1 putative bolA-like protein YAL044W-A
MVTTAVGGPVSAAMAEKLSAAFGPVDFLEIRNDSAKHAGHAAMKGIQSAESHFAVVVVSPVFAGLSRVQRHRRVFEVLAVEMAESIHALQIKALTRDEWEAAAPQLTSSTPSHHE